MLKNVLAEFQEVRQFLSGTKNGKELCGEKGKRKMERRC